MSLQQKEFGYDEFDKLIAQDYKDYCPSCNNNISFDLSDDGMSKGQCCDKYSILIQDKDDKKYVCVPGKNHTECVIIKKSILNKKLKKCQVLK